MSVMSPEPVTVRIGSEYTPPGFVMIVPDVVGHAAVRIEADARLAKPLPRLAVKIDVALHDAILVFGKNALLSGLKVPDHDIRRTALVRDEEQIAVIHGPR